MKTTVLVEREGTENGRCYISGPLKITLTECDDSASVNVISTMKLMYAKPQQKRYSVERLRSLYTRLLRCIDIHTDELCPRGMEDDVDNQNVNSKWDAILSTYISILQPKHQRKVGSSKSDTDRKVRSDKKKLEFDRAFRMIAALNHVIDVASKTDDDSVSLVAEEVSESALRSAHKIEMMAVEIIHEIGDIVVNAERPSSEAINELRSDDVFAYFCEKALLSMLVEIMIDQPLPTSTKQPLEQASQASTNSFNGVVWSPKVKTQIIQTVTFLLSNIRDRSAIYYMLSQHCMNQLIVHMLPLSKWSEPALYVMVQPYVDLLKILAMQLSGSPDLFPLFVVEVQTSEYPNHNSKSDISLSFPLFTSIIHLTTSSYVQCDSYIYATCLNIVVGLLKISDPSIRTFITNHADIEQQQLCTHLSQQSMEQYRRIVNLATGTVVDAERSKAMAIQLDAFNDQLDMYNDIFYCNIRTLNVRLCETLLVEFVYPVVNYLVPGPNQQFFQVGISDRDVIPLREARAHVSILLLARLFSNLGYGPIIRMLAVTLFHPKSTSLWQSKDVKGHTILQTLNKIVKEDENVDTIPNAFRHETLRVLSGVYGEWLVVGVSFLFENALAAIDNETFTKLMLLPNLDTREDSDYCTNTLENSLTTYLDQKHEYQSIVSTIALDCVSSLAVKYIIKSATIMREADKEMHRFDLYFRTSALVKSICTTMLYFFDQTSQALQKNNANDVIITFIESIVQSRYKCSLSSPKRITTSKQQHTYLYALYPYGPTVYCKGPDPLIRKLPGATWNDIEVSRFHISMSLHFRAIHRILRRFQQEELRSHVSQLGDEQTSISTVVPISKNEFELIDKADELSTIFCCLQEKPSIGTDLDLNGRMHFKFTVHGIKDESQRDENHQRRIRTFSEDMIFRETSDLVLVLDATSIMVVRPIVSPQQRQLERGIIICYIPLLDVIAAACDDIRLHVAVRYENLGCLIRNGNMIVTLDSPGTCFIVHQYLEKCRRLLREELHKKIVKLFSTNHHPNVYDSDAPSQQEGVDNLEIPQAKTY